jgi:hypothetical protein
VALGAACVGEDRACLQRGREDKGDINQHRGVENL